MSEVHVYTSFSYAYLSRARILAQTLRSAHPQWKIWAVMVDRPPPGFASTEWERDFDEIIDPEILYPDWKAFVFKHDIVEACTAVKGRAMQHILETGAGKVIYLDPDIAVFHDLDGIALRLDTASVVLTPHQVDPNPSEYDFIDNEQISLKYGIFNLGFVAVKNDARGRAVAAWWDDCLYRACYDQIEDGIFTDQKYCDLLPALFDGVYIERNPGYNVASWNISQRDVEIDKQGRITANKEPLKFYHFTKINSDGEGMTQRFADGNYAVFEIWNWYKRRLDALESDDIPPRYWHYSRLDDGTPIPKRIRTFYRNNLALMDFENPFSAQLDSFASRLRTRGERDFGRNVLKPASSSVACVIHAFYPELLDEILYELSGYKGSLKLFVTVPASKADQVHKILANYKMDVEVILTPNIGRDVLPFLKALPKVLRSESSLILKLHTKRSKHLDNGDVWRKELLSCFIKPNELAAAVKIFDDNPDVGILGPTGHNVSMEGYMGSNDGRLRRLKNDMGMGDVRNSKLGFIAGSMFMARPEALQAVCELNLTEEEFEHEDSQTDGTLAHAVERAWTFSAMARLLKVATKPLDTSLDGPMVSDVVVETYAYAPRSHEVTH
nr:rhamnan synthesis F family protein [uncultured Rhizobium sp.]